MNLKILALLLLLAVISVSASGCGTKDESSVAASEHTDSESDEQETSKNIPDNQDNNEKSEEKETENSEVDGKSPEKHAQEKRKTSEEIFDILYGSWISDNNEDELIFSAGVGDISYKAELITNQDYGFSQLVSYFDAAQTEDGIKIRFITGRGGVGSCKELILSEDEKSIMYKTGIQINDDEIKYNYILFRKKSDTILPETDSKWKGSIGAFLGDSITEGVNTSEGKVYWNYLSEMLDLSVAEPYGLAGSCISSSSDMGTGINPFVTRYKDIRKDADFIVVFGGTNDYGFNTPLGTEEDTSDISFYGALYEMLTGLKKEHPDAAIIFMTPLHRAGFGGFDYDRQRNDAGYSLYDYIDAIKIQCTKLEIPVIDTNTVYGLNPSDDDVKEKYLTDGLHPNEDGHRILAERIVSCFDAI